MFQNLTEVKNYLLQEIQSSEDAIKQIKETGGLLGKVVPSIVNDKISYFQGRIDLANDLLKDLP